MLFKFKRKHPFKFPVGLMVAVFLPWVAWAAEKITTGNASTASTTAATKRVNMAEYVAQSCSEFRSPPALVVSEAGLNANLKAPLEINNALGARAKVQAGRDLRGRVTQVKIDTSLRGRTYNWSHLLDVSYAFSNGRPMNFFLEAHKSILNGGYEGLEEEEVQEKLADDFRVKYEDYYVTKLVPLVLEKIRANKTAQTVIDNFLERLAKDEAEKKRCLGEKAFRKAVDEALSDADVVKDNALMAALMKTNNRRAVAEEHMARVIAAMASGVGAFGVENDLYRVAHLVDFKDGVPVKKLSFPQISKLLAFFGTPAGEGESKVRLPQIPMVQLPLQILNQGNLSLSYGPKYNLIPTTEEVKTITTSLMDAKRWLHADYKAPGKKKARNFAIDIDNESRSLEHSLSMDIRECGENVCLIATAKIKLGFRAGITSLNDLENVPQSERPPQEWIDAQVRKSIEQKIAKDFGQSIPLDRELSFCFPLPDEKMRSDFMEQVLDWGTIIGERIEEQIAAGGIKATTQDGKHKIELGFESALAPTDRKPFAKLRELSNQGHLKTEKAEQVIAQLNNADKGESKDLIEQIFALFESEQFVNAMFNGDESGVTSAEPLVAAGVSCRVDEGSGSAKKH